jgi:hypothetical protein
MILTTVRHGRTGAGVVEDSNRMCKPSVNRAGKREFRNAELADTPKPLEFRRVD